MTSEEAKLIAEILGEDLPVEDTPPDPAESGVDFIEIDESLYELSA
jgi:hypothetical protein